MATKTWNKKLPPRCGVCFQVTRCRDAAGLCPTCAFRQAVEELKNKPKA